MIRIHIFSFESSKKELNRGSIVAVRPREQEWNLEPIHQLNRIFASSIGRIIVEYDGIGSPLRVFFIKLQY